MRKFIHHHWSRAQKSLATRFGRLALLAILLGALLAGLTALWQMSSDEGRLSALLHNAEHVNAASHQAQLTVPPNGKPIGGTFTLVNQDGKLIHDADFRGKFMLVYFGYTYCPDLCPTGLKVIARALDQLGEDADKLQPLFITIDPARDTPAKMKDYVASFHPRIIGLTGSDAQIAEAAQAYQVYYAKGDMVDDKDYVMDHSSLIYLMGPDGKFLSMYNDDVDPLQLIKALREALNAPSTAK